VLKTGISLAVIFSFLLTGCGMMRKVDKMKMEMKLMNEQIKSIKESVDLLTAYAVKDRSPNSWTKAVEWYIYIKNSVLMTFTPFLILGNIANGAPWFAGLLL
jgi:outer membrane murein-binding lipoprotein Lpp